MSQKKQSEPVEVSRFAREEILNTLKAQCRDFELIPEEKQWIMALYASGMDVNEIAKKVGAKLASIEADIVKYKRYTSTLSDRVRARLNCRTLWASLPEWVAAATDSKKIRDASLWVALKALTEVPAIMRELLKLEEDMAKHEDSMRAFDFSQFGESLGEGEKKLLGTGEDE